MKTNWKKEDYELNEILPPRSMFLNYIRGNQDKGEIELVNGFSKVLGINPNGDFKIEMSDACYHYYSLLSLRQLIKRGRASYTSL
jgi:hypothetical protein